MEKFTYLYNKVLHTPRALPRLFSLSRRCHDLPHSDNVVSVTSEQILPISGPCQRDSFRVLCLCVNSELWLQFVQQSSLLQIENLDTRRGSSCQPISGWRESQPMNFRASVQGVQSRIGVQVPQNNNTILACRGIQRSIWGDGDARDVACVADEVSVELVVVQVPRLEKLVFIHNLI